jgi:glycosyltransferase involved in cell wall biosynthesis
MARNESTMIYDTIPFRYPSMPKAALLMRTYMKLVAHRTDAILTCSHYSRQCIERDLGVDSKKVTVVPLGIDPQSMQRVSSHRAVRDASDFILYVGADQPHKNLDRLIEGFLDTGFARVGGRLVIVGVGTRGVSRLSRWEHEARIRVESYVDQPVLEDLLATTRLLVQPSMEEGFGLPVAEAIAARIPIIASSGGSLPEITQGRIPLFDPFSSGAIAAAIDEALSRSNELIQPLDIAWPSPGDLARELIQSIGLKA